MGLHSLHIENNDNGLRIIDFSAKKNMLVRSIIFPRKDIRKYMSTKLENMQPDTRHIQLNVCENYKRRKYRFRSPPNQSNNESTYLQCKNNTTKETKETKCRSPKENKRN